jgi:hypothetical protein
MTKKQAKALILFNERVLRACAQVEAQLDHDEVEHAHAYWLGHIRSIVRGEGYASLPLNRAIETLER